MRDHFEFAVLGAIAVGLVIGEIILALNGSTPSELHAALLIVIAGLLGTAGTKKLP